MAISVSRPDVRWGIKVTTAGTVSTAATSGLNPLYTLNDPSISVGQTVIETQPLHAEAYESTEHNKVGHTTPSVSGLEMLWNAYTAMPVLSTLFQYASDTTGKKVFASAGTYGLYTIDAGATASAPSTAGTCVCTLARIFSNADTDAEDHSLGGAVCSSVTISGDVGGLITISADFVGITHSWSGDLTTPTAAPTTYGEGFPFIDFDSSTWDVKLGGQSLTARSFSITISNGATVSAWNSKTPQTISFAPKLSVTGEVVVQFDPSAATTLPQAQKVLTDLKAGTDAIFLLEGFDTTLDGAGEWQISSNVMYTGDPEPSEGEGAYDLRIPFKGVHDGTNDAIEITAFGTTGYAG